MNLLKDKKITDKLKIYDYNNQKYNYSYTN